MKPPREFLEMLKAAFGESPTDEQIEKTWTQVGKLSTEDVARRRSLNALCSEMKREADLLKKKLAALEAKSDAEREEWWFHIHKHYGIPDGNLHIHDDGRIFMEPKEKPKAEKK